jgi:hypothetical protein
MLQYVFSFVQRLDAITELYTTCKDKWVGDVFDKAYSFMLPNTPRELANMGFHSQGTLALKLLAPSCHLSPTSLIIVTTIRRC